MEELLRTWSCIKKVGSFLAKFRLFANSVTDLLVSVSGGTDVILQEL